MVELAEEVACGQLPFVLGEGPMWSFGAPFLSSKQSKRADAQLTPDLDYIGVRNVMAAWQAMAGPYPTYLMV